MKITSVVRNKNGNSSLNIRVKKWEVFMQVGKYITDGHIIIKSIYVNKIFFPNGTITANPLPEKYLVDYGCYLEREPDFFPKIVSVFREFTTETLYPVNDPGLTMQQLFPKRNRRREGVRLLFSLLPEKHITSIGDSYKKLLDAGFKIGITKEQVLVFENEDEPVAIIMPNIFQTMKEELEALRNIFKDFFSD